MPPIVNAPVNHQPAIHVGNVGNNQPQQPQGPVQFRSGNKGVLTRIAEKLGLRNPVQGHGANGPAFTVSTPSKRGILTSNAAMSMGSRNDRTEASGRTDDNGSAIPDMAAHRRDLATSLQFSVVNNAVVDSRVRLDPNYTITNSKGEQLKGFSISADPNSSQLDTTRPVVLYFSGSGGAAENYGAEIGKAYALDKDVNFVAVNYRGYGDSDETSLSEASIVKDGITMINDLVQKGFNPDQIIIHGYSMGATVASHVQARVEESGHQLRGVIYDRPMTSATGAAQDYAKEMAAEIKDNTAFKAFAGGIGKAVAKLTVGSMSAHKTLKALKESAPNQQFVSPTHFTHDTGAFGARSDRMATDLGGASINLNADHFNQAAFVNTALPQLPNNMFA